MAAKKRAKGKTAKPQPTASAGRFGIRGPVFRDDATYMHREDLLLAESMQAKTMASLQAIALQKVEHEKMLKRHISETHASHAMISALTARGQELEASTAAMWEEMSNEYAIDFKSASYDDETGKITVPEPVKGTDHG